jgi:hypothetical protein
MLWPMHWPNSIGVKAPMRLTGKSLLTLAEGVTMFIETTLIVEGVVDEVTVFEDDDELDKYIERLEAERERIQAETEWQVYVLRHDHAPDIECECAQYEQDHRPAYTLA